MRAAFSVLFFSVIVARAEKNNESVITSLATFDLEEEMGKINNSCLRSNDYMEMTKNVVVVPRSFADMVGRRLFRVCIETIGLNELRAKLGLPPLGAWKPMGRWDERWQKGYNEKLEKASVQEYYMMEEPKNVERSLDNDHVLESSMAGGMAFVEERFPGIRKVFNYQYGKILEKSGGVVGKAEVDELLNFFRHQSREIFNLMAYRVCW